MEKKVIEHVPVAFPYNDYVQSANTLFHFMNKSEHLEWILKNRAIAPRYCVEDMAYLNIVTEDSSFQKVAVLQKCFCDIPFHKLTDTFELDIVGDSAEMLSDAEKLDLSKWNTHPDCYGKYAIAFSKNGAKIIIYSRFNISTQILHMRQSFQNYFQVYGVQNNFLTTMQMIFSTVFHS